MQASGLDVWRQTGEGGKEEEAEKTALAARRKREKEGQLLSFFTPALQGKAGGEGERGTGVSRLQRQPLRYGAAREARANPHQANEAKATVPIDEDLARLPIALEEALEIFLGDISRQIPHEQPAALRVALLARFEKAFDIDGEPNLLLFISTFFARHQRHGRRCLTLRF